MKGDDFMENRLVFNLNNKEFDMSSNPGIAILGNVASGKTTIARKIIKQLTTSSNIECEVLGSKSEFEYSDLNVRIASDNDEYCYYWRIKSLYNELNDLISNNKRTNRLIILDDITDSMPYPALDGDNTFKKYLTFLLEEGYKYGMYFMILSQRVGKTTFPFEYRKNTHIHIFMRVNNESESVFLLDDDSLVSLKRGEYKIELDNNLVE